MLEDKGSSDGPPNNFDEKQIEKLNSAITAIEAGNKVAGAQLLYEIIKINPGNDTAWLWLSSCFDYVFQKKYCLSKALAINPDNHSALKALAQFEQSPQPSNGEMSFIPTLINALQPENITDDPVLNGDKSDPAPVLQQLSMPISVPFQLFNPVSDAISSGPSTNIAKNTKGTARSGTQRRTINIFLFIVILFVVGLAAYFFIYYPGNHLKLNNLLIHTAPTASAVEPVGNTARVTYKVWCDNCSIIQNVSYYPASGDIKDLVNLSSVKVPWQSAFQGINGRRAILEATGVDTEGLIYCSISINDIEVTSAVSHGEVDCVAAISTK